MSINPIERLRPAWAPMASPHGANLRRRRLMMMRLVAVLGLGAGAQVVGWVSIASASTPTPTVVVTPYSRVVNGNIGTATAGVEVQVSLERDGSVVDTAPAVTTNSGGAWTASLPTHAPMAPENSLDDEVIVTYSGVGAPTPSNSRYDVSSSWGALGAVISSDGSTITIYCGVSNCGSSIPVSVHYSHGSTGSFSATPVSGTGLGALYTAALSPAVTAHDTVQYTPTETYEDGTNLSFAFIAGLPGVGNSNSTNFSGVRLPFCFADLANGYLSCEGLMIGATYEVQQDRNGAVVASQTLTATESYEAFGEIVGTLAGLEAGDTINVIVPAENGEPARIVSVIHILPLRVDATSTVGGTALSSISGSCQPGELEEETLTLCPSDGLFEDQQPIARPFSEFQDDLSGNYVGVSVSQFAQESPANEATVPPSFTATATLTNQNKPDTTSTVSLTITLAAGGTPQTLTGNANSPGGVSVVNLAPGHYSALWKMVDTHGDTDSLTTDFTVQAEENKQPTGNNGGSMSSGSTSTPPSSAGAPGPTSTTPTTSQPSSMTHVIKPLTKAQQLARALKVCERVKPRHRRKACEVKARKRYKVGTRRAKGRRRS